MSSLTKAHQGIMCAPSSTLKRHPQHRGRDRHGEADYTEDQAFELGRDWIFLRDEEEPSDCNREAFLQEVRPHRAQARCLQGSEDQVASRAAGPSARAYPSS